MKNCGFLFVTAFLLLSSALHAQRIQTEGNLDFLKTIKDIEVAFTYDNMAVGKYDREADYLDERVQKRNEDEPGSGDEWRAAWAADRENRYEPKFFELFNKYMEQEGINAGKNISGAKYLMTINTYFTEPGFNVGVARKAASINVKVTYTEKAGGKEMGSMTIERVPGRDAMGFDFDTGYRLEEAYAKLGKSLGKEIAKKYR